MTFLPEFAILPEVLEARGDNLRSVFELCLREGLVRNLRKGSWRQNLAQRLEALSPAGRKVIESLWKSGRLLSCPSFLSSPPETTEEWCREAIASRGHRDLRAIFSERSTAERFAEECLVVPTDDAVERENLRPAQSAALRFHIDDYRDHLLSLIRVAREVCFIDPYINPRHFHYRDGFLQILKLANHNPHRPRISIHRKSEDRPGHELCSEANWGPIFDTWHRRLAAWKLQVEVFIWSRFQSRYFVTNHVGLDAGKGFKCDPSREERHHWCRLSRQDHEGVLRDFDSLGNSPTHKLHCKFNLGVR